MVNALPVPGRLSPEAAAFLASIPPRPPRGQLSVEENRQGLRNQTRFFGDRISLARVTDEVVEGRAVVPVRIYHPGGDGDLACVVYAHGGGWALGDLDTHDNFCRNLAKESGCIVVAVGYRQPPEYPYPCALEDVQDVLSAVWWDAGRFGVDRSRIGVGGDSAGGNLAAGTCTWAPTVDIHVRHLLLVLPAVDNHPERWASYTEFADGYVLTRADMIWYFTQYFGPDWASRNDVGVAPIGAPNLHELPPTTVLTAECDPLRDEGAHFAALLAESGVDVEHRCFTGMFHPFILFAGVLDEAAVAQSYAAERLRAGLAGNATGETRR